MERHAILYDRMKTAVIGEDADGLVIYNRALLDLARHYGFQPRACRPYRPKTKGKVERPFRYIREDFFLGASFRNLDDLNVQLRHWLDTVANPRVHATTQRVVNEAFAEEKPTLKPLPLAPYRTVILHEELYDYDNRIVRAFKLRLVKAYADEPTLSRIGRVLLDTGIPELPQLLNVLRGEMSIIGPRLYVGPQSVFAFPATARLSGLKPGLITWAPLDSHHEQCGTGKQSLYDALHYTDNWSLSLDIRIILMASFSTHSL